MSSPAVATIFNSVTVDRTNAGASASEALADGLSRSALLMAVCAGLGIAIALLMARHHQARPVLAFDAELYIEGHTDTVMPRAEAVELLEEIRWAGKSVSSAAAEGRSLYEAAVLAAARDDLGAEPSELQAELIRAFLAGFRPSTP